MSTVLPSRHFIRQIARTVLESALFSALLLALWPGSTASVFAQSVSVLTYHYDNARTGQNNHETTLTQSNVNPKTFGKLFALAVDGWVYAQPLIVSQLPIPHQGTHNVLIVATEHNSVYAFDADIGAPLWQTNLGPSVPTPNNDFGNRYGPFRNVTPEIGITGTPVINPGAQVMYVVAFTKENGKYYQKLHALNITTGTEMYHGPMVIQATVSGKGDGSANGVLKFDPMQHMQRPGLLLLNGSVYIGFGSHADTDPYHGWLMAYNAQTLAFQSVWVSTPNGNEGAIWQSGDGPAADAAGNLYFETGNGTFDATSAGPNQDFGDSIVKLSTRGRLALTDFFTPHDQDYLAAVDLDLGSGGLLLLPTSVGSTKHPHLLCGVGKNGSIYLVDCDQLGGFHSGDDSQIVQALPGVIGGAWNKPAYWNNHLYFGGAGDTLKVYTIYNGQMTSKPTSQSSTTFEWPGASPTISANGSLNGLAWAIENYNALGEDDPGQAILHVYSASNLTHEFYNSSMVPGRDAAGKAVKFATPTVANGKVYVGAEYEVDIYGLGKFVDTPTITPNGGEFKGTVTVKITETTPGATVFYTTDGTPPTTASKQYIRPFVLNNCALVSAKAFNVGTLPSGTAQGSFIVDNGIGTGDGLFGTYFSNIDLTGTTVTRIDPTVNFNWNGGSPITGIGGTNWSARWVGQVQPRCTGTFTFSTVSDDGVRLWVNGQKVIDDWTYHGATLDSGTISLVRDHKYTIRLEYFQGGGGSLLSLLWSCNGITTTVIPQTQIYSTH